MDWLTSKRLLDLRTELRKMVHSSGCQTFHSCPRNCCYTSMSDPMLDLDTAIAWQAAHIINRAVHSHSTRDFTDAYMRITVLYNVLGDHASKYRKLYNKIDTARNIINSLRWR